MTIRSRFCTTTAMALLLAGPAVADVTADDVWANLRTYIDALGGTTEVQTSRTGNVLSVGDISMRWALPFGAGELRFAQTGFDLVETGDGRVEFRLPDEMLYRMGADLPEGSFEGTMVIGGAGLVTTASGSPDMIDYAYGAEQMSFAVTEVTFNGEPFKLELEGRVEGIEGTAQVAVSSLITVTSDLRTRGQSYSGRVEVPFGGVTEFSGGTDGDAFVTEFVLPRTGTDIMNLAAAMEKGLRLSASSQVEGYRDVQLTRLDGEVATEQRTSVRFQDMRISLGRDGLEVTAETSGTEMFVNMGPQMPIPLSAMLETGTMHLALPVAASDSVQDAALSVGLDGIIVDDQLWNIVDPGQAIPRDPMVIRLDLTGRLRSNWDWFDFMDVARRGHLGEIPGELHRLTLNALEVSAAGAELTGQGAAEFDNSDLVSFGGFPKPTGKLELTLKGANALIDRLVGMGLVPEQDAMGARMMMGMIAKPDPAAGEDVLKSVLEMTEDGQILANGLRMR